MASATRLGSETEKKLKDIHVTRDELNKFSEALKDEGFRKLLNEYVEEIQDPENRKRYEDEIAMLEQERGYDVTWIHPKPGFVLKLATAAAGKAFINVCSNDNVGKPSCVPSSEAGRRGLSWSVPYAQSRPREDLDKAGAACTVYDVVFHPDTLHMAGRSAQLRQLVEDTAVRAVDDAFEAGLKRDKVAYPKLKYKGTPQASVVRRRRAAAAAGEAVAEDAPPLEDTIVDQLRQEAAALTLSDTAVGPSYVTPQYKIIYRDRVDMQQFATRCSAGDGRPQALLLQVVLPLLDSAAGLDLDVSARTVRLASAAGERHKYKLEVVLPMAVDDGAGSAAFDRASRRLVVTLPVAAAAPPQPDSGIDSDCARNESDDDAYRTSGERSLGDGAEPQVVQESPLPPSAAAPVCSGARGEVGPSAAEEPRAVCAAPSAGRLYTLPRYTLSQGAGRLYLVLAEPNVDPQSVEVRRPAADGGGLCVTATSVGAGMTPFYFRLLLEAGVVGEPAVTCADDAVRLCLDRADGDCGACRVGVDERNMQAVAVPWQTEEPAVNAPPDAEVEPDASHQPAEDEDEDDVADQAAEDDDVVDQSMAHVAAPSSLSMSSLGSVTSCDGPLSVSSQSSVDESSHKKSILKKRYASESSADEAFTTDSSLLTGSCLLHSCDEMDEARAKKAVRFSDRVVEKRYRSTATIVHDAQRTERQRAKKKRARAARRHSDGDTSENDELRSSAGDDSLDVSSRQLARRSSSDGDTSENDEFASTTTDGSSGAAVGKQVAKKRKNKRKQDRRRKDMLNNELMFELDM